MEPRLKVIMEARQHSDPSIKLRRKLLVELPSFSVGLNPNRCVYQHVASSFKKLTFSCSEQGQSRDEQSFCCVPERSQIWDSKF